MKLPFDDLLQAKPNQGFEVWSQIRISFYFIFPSVLSFFVSCWLFNSINFSAFEINIILWYSRVANRIAWKKGFRIFFFIFLLFFPLIWVFKMKISKEDHPRTQSVAEWKKGQTNEQAERTIVREICEFNNLFLYLLQAPLHSHFSPTLLHSTRLDNLWNIYF